MTTQAERLAVLNAALKRRATELARDQRDERQMHTVQVAKAAASPAGMRALFPALRNRPICVISSNDMMLNVLFDDAASAKRWAKKNAPAGTWSVIATFAPPGQTREQWRATLQAKLNAHDPTLS